MARVYIELVIVCLGRWIICAGVCIFQHVGSYNWVKYILSGDEGSVGVIHSIHVRK